MAGTPDTIMTPFDLDGSPGPGTDQLDRRLFQMRELQRRTGVTDQFVLPGTPAPTG